MVVVPRQRDGSMTPTTMLPAPGTFHTSIVSHTYTLEKLRRFSYRLLDDPPFYLNENPYAGGESACAVDSNGSSFNPSNLGQPTAPTRSLLAQMEANESNSEDFRGVIDDLTIQNKRLKKKLKKYERLHCSHLQEDKLFEVRIHGLAAHRKRELEGILRSFASSSEESPETSIFNVGSFNASVPASVAHKPCSSSTCSKGSRPIDSAYASMSGQAGISQKQLQDHSHVLRQAQIHSKQQNVKSYLDDIPETLVPKTSLVMSERAKSRLVVRRLEQIFTGRRAAPRHSQSHQQQEISKSAAQADRIRRGARGRNQPPTREGVREARILPNDAELEVDSLSEANLAAQQAQQTIQSRSCNSTREPRILLGRADSQIDSSSETNLTGQQSRQSTDEEDSRSRGPRFSRGATPDQRPTRPMDLDLHRAQVPSDNIEYIRHLGLASPTSPLDVESGSDDGWVFLNLLTSLAQLHTLNVTPEFIRNAVANVSSKLELSPDGTKVRWQGGTDGTKMSSDSDGSDDTGNWKSTDTSVSVSKQEPLTVLPSQPGLGKNQEPNGALPFSTVGLPATPEVVAKRRPMYLEQPDDVDKFHYKPLFFHGTTSEDEDASARAANSISSFDPMETSTGLTSGSHGIRESEAKLRKQNRENGPIIFYSKARFCTDLSGDSSGAMHDETAYSRYTQELIGCIQHANAEKLDPTENDYVSHGEVVIDTGGTNMTRSALDLEDLTSSISDISPTSPIPMEVSGLGGIQPEDNFMVKVKVCHRERKGRDSRAQSPFSSPRGPIRRLLHRMPPGSTNTFHEARDIPRSQPSGGAMKSEIISTVKTNMPPSSLPPPSYLLPPFSSSESDDGDDEGEDQEDQEDEDDGNIGYCNENNLASRESSVEDLADPRPANLSLRSSSDESQASSYLSTSSGSEDDSSIDFLANARVLDPDTIAAQEREYEVNSVQQPTGAGSVGATLGQPTVSGLEPPRTAKTESDVDSMSVDRDAEDD